MEVILRESCNACYKLKIKCISAGRGACENCRRRGCPCQFSPRNEMGSPRHHVRKSSTAMRQHFKRISTEQDPNKLDNAKKPNPLLEVCDEYTARTDVIDVPWKSSNGLESAGDMPASPQVPQSNELNQHLMAEASDPPCSSWAYQTLPHSYSAIQPAPQSSPALDGGAFAENFDVPLFRSLPTDPIISNSPCNKTHVSPGKSAEEVEQAQSLDFVISVPNLSISESTGVTNIYPQLAYILFALRTTQGMKHDGEPSTLRNKIFAIVSSLCDMIKSAQMCSPASWGGEAFSPRLMLAASVISVVVEEYARYENEFASPWRYEIGTLNTHLCLQRHAEATVMYIHLRLLRQVFKSTGLEMHDTRTAQMIDRMRATLTIFFDDWKVMMDNLERT